MEHICGRPLGLQFNQKTRELYIADAYFGLLVVGPDGGQAMPVATNAHGVPFGFTNALEIDHGSGVIYFSDSSTLFQRRYENFYKMLRKLTMEGEPFTLVYFSSMFYLS